MVTLVATFGLSLTVSNAAVYAFGRDHVGVTWNPGVITVQGLTIPLGALYVAVISVLIIAGSHAFLTRTYLGNGIRGYSQDISAAQLVGVNPTFVAAVATAIGFSITMAGGALLTVWVPTGINPYLGHVYAPISFVIVVLGGPGRMWGSLVGGLSMGILIDVLQTFFSQAIAYAAAFLVLIPILLLRREGLGR
jgi:branched-subunit amino acid ABC-type transport system permease component